MMRYQKPDVTLATPSRAISTASAMELPRIQSKAPFIIPF